jgi:hypothetical protein
MSLWPDAGLRNSLDHSGLRCGAGGRNRTDMSLRSLDFESSASTNFTTPALWFSKITGFAAGMSI